jgi:hypothetical protein
MSSESNFEGKWVDGPCSENNLALCQVKIEIRDYGVIKDYINQILTVVKELESNNIKKLSERKVNLKAIQVTYIEQTCLLSRHSMTQM